MVKLRYYMNSSLKQSISDFKHQMKKRRKTARNETIYVRVYCFIEASQIRFHLRNTSLMEFFKFPALDWSAEL